VKEELDGIKHKYTSEFEGEDICEVCGVKYPLGGAGAGSWHDKESHKKGKTHQGYAQIRAKIDELLSRRKEWERYRDARRREYEPQKDREKENEKPRERAPERPRPEAERGPGDPLARQLRRRQGGQPVHERV